MAKLSSRQILVGRLPARMQGLDEMFDGLYELGRRPDEAGLGMALVERARAYKNYIRYGSDRSSQSHDLS